MNEITVIGQPSTTAILLLDASIKRFLKQRQEHAEAEAKSQFGTLPGYAQTVTGQGCWNVPQRPPADLEKQVDHMQLSLKKAIRSTSSLTR